MTGDNNCLGKKAYISYQEAKKAGVRLNRHRGGAKGNVYKCDSCNRFHVGNSNGKLKHFRFQRNKIRERLRHGRETFSD